MSRRGPTGGVADLVLAGAAVLACGPVLLARGYVLVGDMTFVPQQPWKDAWLGLDGSAPRAVPADAVVSVLTQVVPGDLLQKVVLVGTLLLAGLGMSRLVAAILRASGRPESTAALAAGVFYLWNPFVHERLAIGHWGLLLGYAALPWIVLAAAAVRRGEPGALVRLTWAVLPAAFGSPTGGLLAGMVVLALVPGGRADPGPPGAVGTGARLGRWRRVPGACAVVAVLNLPWLVPGLAGAQASADPGGVAAFAARADSPLGLWGSLATLGGIWKQSIVAGERDAWLLVLLALAVSLAALLVLAQVRPVAGSSAAQPPSEPRRLLVLGLAGLLLAGLPATGIGADLVAALVEQVPGAGVLRDSQKWVALTAVALGVGVGLGVARLLAVVRNHALPTGPVRVAAVAFPLVLLPSLAWGLAGTFEPARYPDDWEQARRVLAAQPSSEQRTVVLPFSTYQRFAWNGSRAALDPALRYFPGQIVSNDALALSGTSAVAGDNPDAARIAAAQRDGTPLVPVLAEAGVRYVLIEKTAAGAAGLPEVTGTVLHDGPELRLVDLGHPATTARAEHRGLILAGDLVTALLVLGAGGFTALRWIGRKNDKIG